MCKEKLSQLESEIISLRKELDLLYYLLTTRASSSLSNPINTIKRLISYYNEELTATKKELNQFKLDLYHQTKDNNNGHYKPDEFIKYLQEQTQELTTREQKLQKIIANLNKTLDFIQSKHDRVENKLFPDADDTSLDRLKVQYQKQKQMQKKVEKYFEHINNK
jgi:chromosome segregation ATPase